MDSKVEVGAGIPGNAVPIEQIERSFHQFYGFAGGSFLTARLKIAPGIEIETHVTNFRAMNSDFVKRSLTPCFRQGDALSWRCALAGHSQIGKVGQARRIASVPPAAFRPFPLRPQPAKRLNFCPRASAAERLSASHHAQICRNRIASC